MITERKAVYFHGKKDCRLDSEPLPPMKDDEICCRALYSVISAGTEKPSWHREYDATMHRKSEEGKPYCAGYSMSAQVVAVGKDVVGYKPGDIVYARVKHQQYFNIAPGERVARVPEWISPKEACWLLVLRTGMYAAMKAQIRMTDTVLVMGLGIFGAAALQFAKAAGARRVIAVDPLAPRAERAKLLGADIAYCAHAADIFDELRALTGDRMADSVIDATDDASGFVASGILTRSNGNIEIIADPVNSESMILHGRLRRAGLNMHGIWCDIIGEVNPNKGYELPDLAGVNPFYPVTLDEVHETIFEMIRAGRINVSDMTTHIVSPADANELFIDMCRDNSNYLGVLYDWSLV